jgi:RimK family alpha-L-glutamate ligase
VAERQGIARSGTDAPGEPAAPGLLVVYGLKTDDYDWLAGFYPARRLSQACENRGIPLRFLFPEDVAAHVESSRADGAFSPDRAIALVRGGVASDTYAILERAGYRCVNDYRATALARDKLETFRFLRSRGYPTPETWSADGVSSAGGGARAFPVIVKPRFGSRGEGVALAHDADELAAYAGAHAGSHADGGARAGSAGARAEFVAQEYVASSRGRDARAFFAGGDVIAVAERTNGADELRSNACAGGATRLITDGSFARWEAMTLDIAREAGLWYGTVDWLYLPDGGMTVCEINSSPGFEALETCGIDIAGAIVDRLVRA